jgi:predicted  nucleic acid-binding Zn-ribbon protein
MIKTDLIRNNLVATPASFEILQQVIKSAFGNDLDRGLGNMVAIQAWNFACDIAEKERGALQSEFEDQLCDMREEIDGKISDLSDGLSDLVYQKEALQEEIDAHFAGFNINFKGQK